MVNQRNVSILASIAIVTLLLTQFQNCAPANVSESSNAQSGEVRVIEDWNKAEIQFHSSEIQVHDEAESTGVGGLCNRRHNGAKLRWAIWAGQKTNAPLLSGLSACAGGAFNVGIEELPNLVCGVKHLLVAEGEWGSSTFTHVLRRCQPLAAEFVDAPIEAPTGTQCSLEYQPAASEEANPCTQVCYRDNKVVLNRAVPAAQCSSIAAKLAGP
jgi:hypothetical protein